MCLSEMREAQGTDMRMRMHKLQNGIINETHNQIRNANTLWPSIDEPHQAKSWLANWLANWLAGLANWLANWLWDVANWLVTAPLSTYF